MSEPKPYTREDRDKFAFDEAEHLRMVGMEWGACETCNSDAARWLATLAAVEAERDEAQRDATFGTPAFQEEYASVCRELDAALAEVERLREALKGIYPFIAEDFPHGPSDPGACVTPTYRAAFNAVYAALAPQPEVKS